MRYESIVDELSVAARLLELADGDTLVGEGAEADEVYYLRSGRLIASISTARGETRLGAIEPGEFVGEVTVVAGGRRTATLRADGPAVVVGISRHAFEHWLEDHPDVAEEIVQKARQRVDRRQMAAMAADHLGATDPELLNAIVDQVEWRVLEAGEVLFEQGDASDGAYFVVSGRLLVIVSDNHGSGAVTGESLVREIGRGEVVGELGLLAREPRSGTVRALRNTTLARFSAAVFEDLSARFPALLLHVARGLVQRMLNPAERLADRAAAIAVAVMTDEPPGELISILVDEIGRHGTVTHLSSGRVDQLLDRDGIAQAPNVQVPRLGEFMHEADLGNDHLLLETDHDLTSWSRRVLAQADRVVLVVSPRPDRAELDRLDTMLGALERLDHVVRIAAVLHPADTERPTDTGALMDRIGATEVVHVRAGSESDMRRLARLSSGHGIGLVLSGGGARGFAHLGAYRALFEAGIPIDSIGGCSMGAPIAGAIAVEVPRDEIESFIEAQYRRLLDYTVPVVSLLKGRRITRNLERSFDGRDIEDLWIPYFCVSTNLTTSQLEVHRRGNAAKFVRASVALPGILPPVPHEGSLLVDGSVLNNLPVTVMRQHSAIGTVIAVDVAPPRGPRARSEFGGSVSGWKALAAAIRPNGIRYPALSTVLLRSMLTGAVHHQREALQRDVDLLITMNLPGVGLLEFERTRDVAKIGYDSAKVAIDEWATQQTWMKVAS
jgi:predicted acylesterase/phospholipase RssA/CRP-like cAMP-binding protein